MDWGIEDSITHLKEIAISAVSTFIAAILVWPPEPLYYWEVVPDGVGDTGIASLIVAISVVLGAVIAAVADIRLRNFTIGGMTAYYIGMRTVEMVYNPISPVHFVLYGLMLVGFIGGAVLVTVTRKTGIAQRIFGDSSALGDI